MKCPTCPVTLVVHQLEGGLSSHACGKCGGQWNEGDRYFKWLEAHKAEPEVAASGAATSATVEPGSSSVPNVARLCPTCGRILFRATVGHGLSFQLDRCPGCAGTWFNIDEWEALKSRGLHDDVHFVFSAAWQADVARAEREKQHEAMLLGKFGEADYTEVKRVRAWLDTHPHRAELYGVLLDGAEGLAGVKQPTTRR